MAVHMVQRGLVVRISDRDYKFERGLEQGELIFVDVRTGNYKTVLLTDLQKGVLSGKIAVVSGDSLDCDGASKAKEMDPAVLVTKLSEEHQHEWHRKLQYVQGMRRIGVQPGSREQVRQNLSTIAKRINDLKPPSASTVLNWTRTYLSSGGNPASLIPRATLRRTTRRIDQSAIDQAFSFLRKYYFQRRGMSLEKVWGRLQSEYERVGNDDVKKISRSTFWRIAQSVPAYERDRSRLGPGPADAKWRHSIGGIYATRPLERVEMDHAELDLYVIDDVRGIPLGRPVLTVMVDKYSRYILAAYISFDGESLGRVVRTIKLALSPKDDLAKAAETKNEWLTPGMWECLVVDNGLAFQSPQLKNITLGLGCDLEYCPVRKPWFKGSVERTILDIGAILPSEGRSNKLKGLVEPYDPMAKACIMFSDLVACVTKWAVDVHPFRIPARSLQRPIDLIREGLSKIPAPVVCSGLDNLEILAGISREVMVGPGGIEFYYLPYRCAALAALARQQRTPKFKTTIKYDPNDIGRIWVQDPTSKEWITVPCLYDKYAMGLSLRQHKMIRKVATEKLRGDGAYETFMRAQQHLREMFDKAILRGKRKRRDYKNIALLSGVSSLSLGNTQNGETEVHAEQLVIAREQECVPEEIPDFAVVHMDRSTYMDGM